MDLIRISDSQRPMFLRQAQRSYDTRLPAGDRGCRLEQVRPQLIVISRVENASLIITDTKAHLTCRALRARDVEVMLV